MYSRRQMVGALGGAMCCLPLSSASVAQSGRVPFRPEDFGARGDGVSNDSAAFAALAQSVNLAGGGIIEFRRATYVVGVQWRATGGGSAFRSLGLLEFIGCSQPLVIRGNGATIRAASGLRYGSFDALTGQASRRALPNVDHNEVAAPYGWMIMARDCTAVVEISDFELDGNVGEFEIGGLWGDTGRQIRASGIGLYGNHGPEFVRNVYTHHHALDGIIIDGLDRDRPVRSQIENLRSEHNARQGCSIVGGRGYDFQSCRFAYTGSGAFASAPGAGVDIEAESKSVRDLTFTDCEFVDNAGPSLAADSGDSDGAIFRRCTFVGTRAWSAWPKKPNFRFHDSTFVGAIANAFADFERPERATKFYGCRFLDDPALSPTRQVYTGHAGTIAELSSHPNVLFSRCQFRLTHAATLPWTNTVTYDSCTMSQRSRATAYPRGRYLGRTTIAAGPVELNGSSIEGELIINGRAIPRGRQG